MLLLEKEAHPAVHQTGHNSGVVHAGVYYEPGSLKARFCRAGLRATEKYCRQNSLPFERTGKLLVATRDDEIERMEALYVRCRRNRLEPERLSARDLQTLEPRIRGTGALLVSDTAITDYPAICRRMLQEARDRGAHIEYGNCVTAIEEGQDGVRLRAGERSFSADRLLVCGGLMADRLARMHGIRSRFRIVPFRGEYYRLHPRLNGLVRHLIYPIPDPALPFLGVHLTRMTDGSITVGPNAVLGWKREGYGRFNFRLDDTLETLRFSGAWKLAARHFASGTKELRDSVWKRGYLKRVRRYAPEIPTADLLDHPAGIRAQAVLEDGTLVHDFLLEKTPRSLHVCNAPSPAATSAIPIGRHVCDILLGQNSIDIQSEP